MPFPEDEPAEGQQSQRSRRRTRSGRPAGRRAPQPPTRESLERAALRYLERYETSEHHLRQVLERKARTALDATDADATLRGEAHEWIAAIVSRAVELRLVDDRRYAEGLARRLDRRGGSHRAKWQKLRQKGLPEELIREQLGNSAAPEAELTAAAALARRRGLGPWRSPALRAERRERDLAALARAGFDLDVARRVIDSESPESLPEAPRGSPFA